MDRAASSGSQPQSAPRVIQHPRENRPSEAERAAMVRRNAMLRSEPFPIVADQFVRVQTEHLASYFKKLRTILMEEASRGNRTLRETAGILSEDDFILVCRYLTACRVSRVYCIFRRLNEPTTLISRDFVLPKVFAEKINLIGVATVQGGAYRVCPQPELSATPIPLSDVVNRDMLNAFSSLVESARVHGDSFDTSTFAESIVGSSWWFMTCRNVDNPDEVAKGESVSAVVRASHKEWGEDDISLCARMQNQFDGKIPVEKELKYTSGPVGTRGPINVRPRPNQGDLFVEVKTEKMSAYFATVRLYLRAAVKRSWEHSEADTISEDDFVYVCRWMTACRVKHIYNTFTTRRPSEAPQLLGAIVLPTAICEVINGIGVVTVDDDGYEVCPEPEPSSPELEQEPSDRILHAFSLLVEAAKSCGFIDTDRLTCLINGTSWWLLTARRVDDQDVIARHKAGVVVYGSHKDWTSSDGLLCAVVQNEFNGILPIEKTLKWCIGTYSNIPSLLCAHNLPAEALLHVMSLRK